jgi:hypothetical protein
MYNAAQQVCSGQKRTLRRLTIDVRFTPESRHRDPWNGWSGLRQFRRVSRRLPGGGYIALAALMGLVFSESYGFQLSAERLRERAQQVNSQGSLFAQGKEALEDFILERKAECASGLPCISTSPLETSEKPHVVPDRGCRPMAEPVAISATA